MKVFNLVTPAASDSWNCLSEIEGQELMAQLFCDVIIKNTGSDRGDHFWDCATRSPMVKSRRTNNGNPMFGELVI